MLTTNLDKDYYRRKGIFFIMHPAQPSEAKLGGVHSILGLPHDWHIYGPEKGIHF